MGFGRATFESTLRATFADFFSHDTDGAFANIVLQSGLSSSLAFFLFPHITCSGGESASEYCVEFQDGTWHDVFALALIVIVLSVVAVLCYLRASVLFREEQEDPNSNINAANGSSSRYTRLNLNDAAA